MKKLILIISFLIPFFSFAQKNEKAKKLEVKNVKDSEIHWLSFEEAVKLNNEAPKKILIDVYTQWCGWCKKMEASTYKDPIIVDYINKKYYAVKLDAETKDSIHFRPKFGQGKTFGYNPENKANEFAVSILQGKMGYPTSVFMDENYQMLSPIPGFQPAESLEMILKFFGEEEYKKGTKWEDYQKTFKGEVGK